MVYNPCLFLTLIGVVICCQCYVCQLIINEDGSDDDDDDDDDGGGDEMQ